MPEPKNRVQKFHKKSRAGCISCKARKVKCDEKQPSCGSCIRRQELCQYTTFRRIHTPQRLEKDSTESLLPAPLHHQSGGITPPYVSVGDIDRSYLAGESTERRLLEMKLMHHFTTATVAHDFLSMHDQTVSDMWKLTAPTLSFKFPFLLNIILSIAALHILKIQSARLDMANLHRTYFNAAISQHRKAVQEISPENAEAVCISTILIALPAFILLQNGTVKAYTPPLQLFHLLASSKPLFGIALRLLPQTSKIKSVVTAKPDMTAFMKEIQKLVYKEPFYQLSNWRAADEIIDPESGSAYDLTLSFVGCILVNIERNEDAIILRRMLYSFPSLVPPVFVERLQEHNPRALAILAHYFCLIKSVDGVWWMRGIAEREVFGIQSILPEEWQWTMAWPVQKLAEYAALVMPPMQA